jgi:hypothetical protein
VPENAAAAQPLREALEAYYRVTSYAAESLSNNERTILALGAELVRLQTEVRRERANARIAVEKTPTPKRGEP